MANFKKYFSGVSFSSVRTWADGQLNRLPWPALTKRAIAWVAGVVLLLMTLNWVGLPTSLWDLLSYGLFAVLIIGLWWPRAVLRGLLLPTSRWVALPLQAVCMLAAAIILQASLRLEVVALVIFFLLPVLWIFLKRGLGESIKVWIPGKWDDPHVDRLVTGTTRWIPRAMITIFGLLVIPLVFLIHVRDITVKGVFPETADTPYKVSVLLENGKGRMLVNKKDFRFWKFDPGGFSAEIENNIDRKLRVVTIGINWPGMECFENCVRILKVYDAEEGSQKKGEDNSG